MYTIIKGESAKRKVIDNLISAIANGDMSAPEYKARVLRYSANSVGELKNLNVSTMMERVENSDVMFLVDSDKYEMYDNVMPEVKLQSLAEIASNLDKGKNVYCMYSAYPTLSNVSAMPVHRVNDALRHRDAHFFID